MSKKLAQAIITASLAAAIAVPYNVVQVQAAAPASFADLTQAGSFQAALSELITRDIFSGYEDGTIRPNRTMTRAEWSKVLVLAFEVPAPASAAALKDAAASEWFFSYAEALVGSGAVTAANGEFLPNAPATQEYIVNSIAKLVNKKLIVVQGWAANGYVAGQAVTRAEAASWLQKALQNKPLANAQVTAVKALNPITLEVKFSAPLATADLNLDQAKKNFVFDNGMELSNVPQLKSGTRTTYIVPVTTQKLGTKYALTYKGSAAGTFEAVSNKLALSSIRQIAYDTVEIDSIRSNGVIDYEDIVEADIGSRNGLELTLDDSYSSGGKHYEVISSLRGKQVQLKPDNGPAITATYVPFTQATDGRQAPKFRLASGESLKPGTTYKVTADWATIASDSFKAAEAAALTIQSAAQLNETSVQLTLAQDPKDELFAGRSVTLKVADGTTLTATYRFTSRNGAAGTFDLANNGKLASGTAYQVTPVGNWAAAANVTLTTK
ncbi:S-layer homology domain-containing protein [Paenibacillus filicis]|uniref:S-layer homology domain-containing protein n=1 Tax=Paenibacillus gyeongsangnamensis TaxID=3388067 RepID=A0ABT4QCQ0_9BACL|nr:S-layer homology domain-containing protein [Paenibacillus filicis]MCZ8514566.1 S-layer homology domain-containing protein [Paenibacillus filicis]